MITFIAPGIGIIGTDQLNNNGTASIQWNKANEYNKKYYWYISVDDGKISSTSPTWTFTTVSQEGNNPPKIFNPHPINNSINISTSVSNISINIEDPDGDLIHWYIETSPDIDYFIKCPPAPSGINTSFGYEWGYANGNHYDDGAFWFTRDGGNLWRELPTMYEFTFKTYGYS